MISNSYLQQYALLVFIIHKDIYITNQYVSFQVHLPPWIFLRGCKATFFWGRIITTAISGEGWGINVARLGGRPSNCSIVVNCRERNMLVCTRNSACVVSIEQKPLMRGNFVWFWGCPLTGDFTTIVWISQFLLNCFEKKTKYLQSIIWPSSSYPFNNGLFIFYA